MAIERQSKQDDLARYTAFHTGNLAKPAGSHANGLTGVWPTIRVAVIQTSFLALYCSAHRLALCRVQGNTGDGCFPLG